MFKTADTHLKTDTFRVSLVELNTGGAASTISQFLDDVTLEPREPCMEGEVCIEDADTCGTSEVDVIVDAFCAGFEVIALEAVDDLERAGREVLDCFDDTEACLRRANPVEVVGCMADLAQCARREGQDVQQVCQRFGRDFLILFRQSMNTARQQGLQEEFLNDDRVQEKIDSATALLQTCSGAGG